MAAKALALQLSRFASMLLLSVGLCAQSTGPAIPVTQATALDGHAVSLPKDLSEHATVLILGFGRHSADATTAWEKPVRAQLEQPGHVGYYDMAMLAEVPGLVRPWVLRSIKHDVPDVLKPHFLPLIDNEAAWRHAAGYDEKAPEAAYVLLVDAQGNIRWATHQAYNAAAWQQLNEAARHLEATVR